MDRIRLIGGVLVIALVVFLFRQGGSGSAEKPRQGGIEAHARKDEGPPGERLRKDRDVAFKRVDPVRKREETVDRISKDLMEREKARISDRTEARRKVKVDEILRKNFGIPVEIESVECDITCQVVDAPADEERGAISEMIRDGLFDVPFPDEGEREKTAKELEKRFLNYPKTKKLIKTHVMQLPGWKDPKRWILVFNTDEVVEWDNGSGISLASKGNSGFELIEKSPEESFRRYKHLTPTSK